MKNVYPPKKTSDGPVKEYPEFLNSYQHHTKTTQSKLNQLQDEINKYNLKIQNLNDKFVKKETTLDEKEKELKDLQSKIVNSKKQFAKSANSQAIYQNMPAKNNQKNILRLCSLQSLNKQLREEISNLRIEKAMYLKINNNLIKEIKVDSNETQKLIDISQKSEELKCIINNQLQDKRNNLEQNNQLTQMGMIIMKDHLISINKQSKNALFGAEQGNTNANFTGDFYGKSHLKGFKTDFKTSNKTDGEDHDSFIIGNKKNKPTQNKENVRNHSIEGVDPFPVLLDKNIRQSDSPEILSKTRENPQKRYSNAIPHLEKKITVLKRMELQKNEIIAELNEQKSYFEQLFKETDTSSVDELLLHYSQMEDEKSRLYLENQHLLDQIKGLKEQKMLIQNELKNKQVNLVKISNIKTLISKQNAIQNKETQSKIEVFQVKRRELSEMVTSFQMALPVVLERLGKSGKLTRSDANEDNPGVNDFLFELENSTNQILRAVRNRNLEEELVWEEKDVEQKSGMEEKGKDLLVGFEETIS